MDSSLDPTDSAEARRFAARHLGPRSERAVAEPDASTRIGAARQTGRDLEDAVLAEVHRVAVEDPEVANEFVAYFLADLVKLSGASLSNGLHRHLDSGDLVQSVLRELWPQLSEIRFETRGRFLAFLSMRLGWKASAKARKVAREREVQELEASEDVHEAVAGDEPTPLSALESEEERELLLLKLVRLPERDRTALTAYVREEPIEAIAAKLGSSRAAAHKAVQRAIQRFRALR